MFHLAHILVDDEKKEFTYLNRFDRKKGHFEGEYSLIHNEYSMDSYFLERFLLDHKGRPLLLMSSDHPRFFEVTNTYSRFQENDIPKYIEEKIHLFHDLKSSQEMDRNLGQLQLAILKKMIEKQVESIRNQSGKTSADHQVFLGKELSLQWVLHVIEDIVEKGNLR